MDDNDVVQKYSPENYNFKTNMAGQGVVNWVILFFLVNQICQMSNKDDSGAAFPFADRLFINICCWLRNTMHHIPNLKIGFYDSILSTLRL